MEREVAILFLAVLMGLAYQQWDLEKKNQSLSEELSVLKDKIKYLESMDLDVEHCPSFSATLKTHPFILAGTDDVVKFDEVKINIGSGYDRHSGHFVSPKSGIYLFSVMILGNHGNTAHYQLNINETPFVLGYSQSGTDSSTISMVVRLKEGDRVYVKHGHNAMEEIYGNHRSSFSGVFLHA